MSRYPLDNPFRRPVELASAAALLAGAAVLPTLATPTDWSPLQISGLQACLLFGAGLRLRQGIRLIQAQRHLRLLPRYVLRPEAIPSSRSELFLGMGFWWTARHTQRLLLSRQDCNARYRARSPSYVWARAYARKHPASALGRLIDRPAWWNPLAPLPPAGGDPAIHGVEPQERAIWTPLSERVGHTLVLGTTRVGKTRLAELLITQDIRRGEVVIVFDPKGDLELLSRMLTEAERAGRAQDFYLFHLGYPELSDRYSPISTFGRITEVATRVANPLPGTGNSAAFKQFVWLYINLIARAATALGMNPTYALIYRYAADLDALAIRYFEQWLDRAHPGWRLLKQRNDLTISERTMQGRLQQMGRTETLIEIMDLIQKQDWHDPIAEGLLSVLANNKSKYQALINSLFPLLEKLTTGKTSELLSPSWDDVSDPRRIFTWDRIMATGGIVYVGLDSLSDHEVAAAVGNAMFADLTSTAGRRYKFGAAAGQAPLEVADAPRIAIHADEFNELIGDEFIPLLNKAGGAGYQVAVYTQTWSDVEAKIGSAAKAAQIGGNLNTLIMLRVKNAETAAILTDQLAEAEIALPVSESSASDADGTDTATDFSSATSDRLNVRSTPLLQPADLVQLPKGQAFALLEGGQLAKIRLPLLEDARPTSSHSTALESITARLQALRRTGVGGTKGGASAIGGAIHESLTIAGKGDGF